MIMHVKAWKVSQLGFGIYSVMDPMTLPFNFIVKMTVQLSG